MERKEISRGHNPEKAVVRENITLKNGTKFEVGYFLRDKPEIDKFLELAAKAEEKTA